MGRSLAVGFAFALALAACGGDDEVVPDAVATGNTIDASVSVPDAMVSIDAQHPDATALDASSPDAVGFDAVPTCPNTVGEYNISAETGTCGNMDSNSSQFIAAGTGTCVVNFTSVPSKSTPAVVATGIPLDASGNFTGQTLTLGTTSTANCAGTWNQTNSTMSLDCGAGTCTMLLTRI